jgi:hypothetical protein
MRLKSTKLAIWFFAPAVAGYAWICEQHVHVSAICVTLFIASFFTMFVLCMLINLAMFNLNPSVRWIYSSALAYLVDANAGHSSVAVAANNMVRGISAFVAAEVAVPLQVYLPVHVALLSLAYDQFRTRWAMDECIHYGLGCYLLGK